MFKHSLAMFGSMIVATLFSYFYHVFMARSLGPASYGELGSLLALFTILAVPIGTIQIVIAKFTAGYGARNESGKIGSLLFSAIRKLLTYGLGIFILVVLLSGRIAGFLRLDSPFPVMIIGFAVLFSVTLPVNRGVLQGTHKFPALALNNSLESASRFIAGVALVVLGLGINGAVIAFGLGFLISFFLAFIPLKRFFRTRDRNIDVKGIYRFTVPVFLSVLLINLTVNLPTLFIKHFYSAEFTGCWNVSLMLAGIILFISNAASLVLFSKVSSSSDSSEKKNLFEKSRACVTLGSLFISILFYFFSKELLVLLFGDAYSGGEFLLKWIGFGLTVIAVVQLKIFYKLAQKASPP